MMLAPELSGREPTASQNAVETQDTALRLLAAAPGGDTARWSCQEVPFQLSARAICALDVPAWKSPAASHAATPAQDTSLRLVTVAVAGLGGVCAVQEVPSHVAARLNSWPALSVNWPAASQNAAVRQDTPLRLANVEPAGPAMVCALQDAPFQMSPPPLPTLSQKVADTHDIAPAPAFPGSA